MWNMIVTWLFFYTCTVCWRQARFTTLHSISYRYAKTSSNSIARKHLLYPFVTFKTSGDHLIRIINSVWIFIDWWRSEEYNDHPRSYNMSRTKSSWQCSLVGSSAVSLICRTIAPSQGVALNIIVEAILPIRHLRVLSPIWASAAPIHPSRDRGMMLGFCTALRYLYIIELVVAEPLSP